MDEETAPVITISGEAAPLRPGPILACGAIAAFLFPRRRVIAFAVGAGIGYWLETSGALDALIAAKGGG